MSKIFALKAVLLWFSTKMVERTPNLLGKKLNFNANPDSNPNPNPNSNPNPVVIHCHFRNTEVT